jgi:hypothetical protein
MTLPERTIQAQILDYLRYRGIKAFRINAGMIPTGEKRSRRMIRLAPKGFSDIVGVLGEAFGQHQGKAIFVEVKTTKGKTTPFQDIFLEEMREQGALAFVARSTEDVERELEEVMAR